MEIEVYRKIKTKVLPLQTGDIIREGDVIRSYGQWSAHECTDSIGKPVNHYNEKYFFRPVPEPLVPDSPGWWKIESEPSPQGFEVVEVIRSANGRLYYNYNRQTFMNSVENQPWQGRLK